MSSLFCLTPPSCPTLTCCSHSVESAVRAVRVEHTEAVRDIVAGLGETQAD